MDATRLTDTLLGWLGAPDEALAAIKLTLAAAWVVYLLWLGGWIVLQKREPVATLSWLLCLALLPVLGFLVYYLLGPQRIARQTQRRARFRTGFTVPQASGSGLNPEYRELMQVAGKTTGLPPSCVHDIDLLVDGGEKYPRLLADIASAQQSIHLTYYIYLPDRIGTELRDALAGAARRGVAVRLLVDGLGAARASETFFRPLREAGAEVRRFHPSRWRRFWQFWRRPWINLRTHRKIVVIDNRIGYIGGINITDEQDERHHPNAYRDLHVRMAGAAVMELQQVFAEDWRYAGGDDRVLEDCQPPAQVPEGKVVAQVISSGPDTAWESIHRMYVGAIFAARKRVWLATPYFVPGEAAMMALTSAALAGLDVRLIVPKRSDSRLVTLAARSYFGHLLRAGVKVHEYGPRMLHSKALLVDDDFCLIGSANFDHRSFRLNFEAQLLVQDAGFATRLATQLEGELAHAPEVVRPAGKRPLLTRLPEAFARLMSPLL